MTRAEIAKKVRFAHIQSRTLLSGSRAGLFKVHATGSGYDFDQLSEYYEGGDFRRIDWKSSARTNTLLLREYKDEQNRTIHVMVDSSSSMAYGTTELLVSEVAQELACAIELISKQSQDNMMHHNIDPSAMSWKDIFEMFSMRHRRRSLLVIISDFIMNAESEKSYKSALRILARQHEIMIIRVRDRRELEIFLLAHSFVCTDSEHANSMLPELHAEYAQACKVWRDEQDIFFKQCAIPVVDCYTGNDNGGHIDTLLSFLKRM